MSSHVSTKIVKNENFCCGAQLMVNRDSVDCNESDLVLLHHFLAVVLKFYVVTTRNVPEVEYLSQRLASLYINQPFKNLKL